MFKHSNLRSRIRTPEETVYAPSQSSFTVWSLAGQKGTHTVKSTGGYQSLFPCLGEGTHVITLPAVLRYPVSKYREQKWRARLNLRAPTRKVAWGWNKNQEQIWKSRNFLSSPTAFTIIISGKNFSAHWRIPHTSTYPWGKGGTTSDIFYFSKIQLVVYYQCCVLIGWATTWLYVIAH